MRVQCDECQKIKETEIEVVKWTDESDEPNKIGMILRRLEEKGYADYAFLYACPVCGQVYKYIWWNDLFPDGWYEFAEIRKVSQ